MKIKSILIAAAGLLLGTSCNGQHKQEVKIQNPQTMGKKIVIFFSHAGDNYSVGNIQEGNTKVVADYISELTGADQYEIMSGTSMAAPHVAGLTATLGQYLRENNVSLPGHTTRQIAQSLLMSTAVPMHIGSETGPY